MNTYYCTHCGKKNAILDGDFDPEPEDVHEHDWFLAARLADGTKIMDCTCGERKRELPDKTSYFDNERYETGSVNRALYVR